jgi:hypothetical protein
VDQYVDNRQKEILWDILANLADNGASYAQSLERLVHDNPQSGILHVLHARTGDKQLLYKAAVYYAPRTLFQVINRPGDLMVVDPADINYPATQNIITESATEEVEEMRVAQHASEVTIVTGDDVRDAAAEAVNETAEVPKAESEASNTDIPSFVTVHETASTESVPVEQLVAQQEPQVQEELVASPNTIESIEETLPQQPLINEHVLIVPERNTVIETYHRTSRFPKRDVPNQVTPSEPEYPQQQDIEDDVYDEIVGIDDIGFEVTTHAKTEGDFTEARFSDPMVETGLEEEEASAVLFHQPDGDIELSTDHKKTIEEEGRLILGGIVNTDYLSFDKKLDELRNAAPTVDTRPVETPEAEAEPEAETREVSRYDDDKMPYTFMWWLNKTRKEHAENIQPYAPSRPAEKQAVDAARRPKAADELQQQYYENIFSLTSVSGVDRETDPASVAFDHNKKEDIIIERFIHTEPQIKPLSADKLDNENKAKKSSEDQNDFVTETLARIYTDQMLYHKAIATYKKLILKYPEKKLYFAAQIEQLEKKTN